MQLFNSQIQYLIGVQPYWSESKFLWKNKTSAQTGKLKEEIDTRMLFVARSFWPLVYPSVQNIGVGTKYCTYYWNMPVYLGILMNVSCL